jgi:hypothetical protein
LRDLRSVIPDSEQKTDALVDKCRNIVADIENEPNRDKARDAVQINLQEIAEDVAIEESHGLNLDYISMIALKDSLGTEFVERIRAIFSEKGHLSKAKNFEFRPPQQEMAMAVARALEEERHLVVEAGTGVGKSLAYLAPAILFALEQHKKAIVSTHTINLQEQLLYKDIPILRKILPVEFEAALMKGRQNYLCPRRLERALQPNGRVRRAMDRLAICRSSRIRRFGLKSAASHISARAKIVGSNRTVSTSKRASGFSRRM